MYGLILLMSELVLVTMNWMMFDRKGNSSTWRLCRTRRYTTTTSCTWCSPRKLVGDGKSCRWMCLHPSIKRRRPPSTREPARSVHTGWTLHELKVTFECIGLKEIESYNAFYKWNRMHISTLFYYRVWTSLNSLDHRMVILKRIWTSSDTGEGSCFSIPYADLHLQLLTQRHEQNYLAEHS